MVPRSRCTGCGACVHVCPTKCLSMKSDEFGFYYPKLTDPKRCVSCKKCDAVCSNMRDTHLNSAVAYAFGAYTNDDIIRAESSSGGVFGEIAEWVVSQNGVVCAAVYDECLTVKHICSENAEDIKRMFGAKYSQSDMGNVIAEIKAYLESDRLVLFCGTPCQVAGVKNAINNKTSKLICVDFICHGVPSPAVWQQYLRYRSVLDNHGMLPLSVNQRDKQTGWSRYRYSSTYEYDNQQTVSIPNYQDLYMRLFIRNAINRESCGKCDYKGFHRFSDITIGDFWGVWDLAAEMDDDKGTSLVMVHTKTGEQIMQRLSHRLITKRVELETATKMNVSFWEASKPHWKREEILYHTIHGEFNKAELCLAAKPSIMVRMVRKVKRLLKK